MDTTRHAPDMVTGVMPIQCGLAIAGGVAGFVSQYFSTKRLWLEAIEDLFVRLFTQAHKKASKQNILDLDAMDDPIHGHQQGRFFHGYYDGYCYLPLYIFCGRHLPPAKLRRSNIDGAAGAREEVERIVTQIRLSWPRTRILLRADSGFCREALMTWCEANKVDYLFGLARNARLDAEIVLRLGEAADESHRTGKVARRFKNFMWSTLDSWSCGRRVVGKAEVTRGDLNARILVTSLNRGAPSLRGDLLRARRDGEPHQGLPGRLVADRTSTATKRANQLRLWFASMGLSCCARCAASACASPSSPAPVAGPSCLKLLKIGARVTVSVRRVKIAMASAHPWRDEWELARLALRTAAAR